MLALHAPGAPLEECYTIPNDNAFKIVNTAVWYTFKRLFPGFPLPCEQIDGGTCYTLSIGDDYTQLFVLRTSEHTAEIRLHLLLPVDPVERSVCMLRASTDQARRRIEESLAVVLAFCHQEVCRMLRRAFMAEGTEPPPPLGDIKACIRWADLCRPGISNAKLGEIIGASEQTIKNVRSQTGQTKRVVRGKVGRK